MADEFQNDEIEDEIIDAVDNEVGDEEEYEEIDSDEVDRIVETLDRLIETVTSETIQVYLTDASTQIHEMFYGEDEDEEEGEEFDEGSAEAA